MAEIDWRELGRLPHLALSGADLDLVEWVQLGLIRPWLEPTDNTLLEEGRLVLTDRQGTPLAVADPDGTGWRLTRLRDTAGLTPLPEAADAVVIVDGAVDPAERPPHPGTLWIVPTRPGRSGRAVLAQARKLAGDDLLVRLPQPEPGSTTVFRSPVLPSPQEVAERLGAADIRHLGSAAGSVPSRGRGGSVVFFTGLSGSGKSTLATALQERLEQLTTRELTLLDGDEVRRTLSAGLGFDAGGRAANIRRIGWVAALAARHGGIAIAAPIAPFADGRAEARALAEEVGQFVLIWVSTSLEACEARDRKGLYARARAGEIAEFTGISSPYQEPTDADLVIDTAATSVDEAVGRIVAELRRRDLIAEERPW